MSVNINNIHRHYFAIATNPGEQFFNFTSLCAWLIRKCGKKIDQPQEFDDPNATISKILDFMRSIVNNQTILPQPHEQTLHTFFNFAFQNVVIDFSPSRLKQGVGEHAIYVLNNLCDNAMKACKFTYKK